MTLRDNSHAQTSEVSARTAFVGLSLILSASVLLPLPDARGQIAHLPSICPFYNLTGLPCPGCGLTRAFACLGHGHLWDSLHWHPLGWLAYAVCVLLWVRSGIFWLGGGTLMPVSPLISSRLAWASVALLLLTGILRIAWLTQRHLAY